MKKRATISSIRRAQIASANDSDRAHITAVSDGGHPFTLDVSWSDADGMKDGDTIEIAIKKIAAPAPKRKR